jgi:transcription elongation factor GreA
MVESHLSPQAFERLREELAWRTGEHRRELSLAIERARELGDLSENADYDAAKDEQGKSEARVRQIEQILKDAVVVEGASGDVVEPGCLVELRYDDDAEPTTYLVGSIEERDDTYDVLSPASPLGQAILGVAPGTSVTYQGPRRELSVTVVGVRPRG